MNPDPLGAITLLGEPTRRRLYEFVAGRSEPTSRDDAAEGLGISRELAAFHLDRLVAVGLLVAEYRRLHDRTGPGAGRPSKLYRRASQDLSVSLPARHYDVAADVFATALEELNGGAVVAEKARALGADLGAEARHAAGSRPSHRRLLAALVDLLERRGYEPQIGPDRRSVALRNCPFRALTASHRQLTCGMNRSWAEGVVDGLRDPGLRARPIANPIDCCVAFEPPARRRAASPG
jgi:predicted ArsR family transcriptional regulator